MTIARTSIVFTLAQVALLVVGLVSSIVISRALGPSGRGILALTTIVATSATLLATIGLGTAYTYLAGKKSFDYDELVGSTVVTAAFLGTVSFAVLLAISGVLLDTVLRGMTWAQYVIVATSLPFAYLSFFIINLMIGAGQAGRAALIQLCAGLFGAGLSVVAVVVNPSVSLLVLVGTASTIVIGFWSLAIVARDFGIKFSGTRQIARTAAKYGATVYLGTLSGQFWLRADYFVLNNYAGPAAVGQYSIATSLAEKLWLLDSSVSQATLSQVIGSGPTESARIVAKTSRNVLFIAALGCLALGLASPWLIPFLFGDEFRSAVVPVWLLLPGVLFIAAARPMSGFFSGQLGRPQITSAVSVLTAGVGVAAYLILVPALGAAGAALGSSIAYGVPILAYVPLFLRATGMPARELLLINREDVQMYRRLFDEGLRRVGSAREPKAE